MKIHPIVKPKACLEFNKIKPVDLSRFGYKEEIERYNRYHPLNLYMGVFVFLFDVKIMLLSLVFNELIHNGGFESYHKWFIGAIQLMSVPKLGLYISNNIIERKEAALLVSLNSKKLFKSRKHVFFYFYILLSLINHLPVPSTSSYYEISIFVKPIHHYYKYNVHDFFTILCITRSFFSVLFILNYFSVNQTKYRRVVAHAGIYKYDNFTLRYFFNTYPIAFSFIFLSLFVVGAALMIRVIERPNPVKDFSMFANSAYFVTTTITTLGYGDYTPLSDLGRMFSLVIMIIGLVNINMVSYAMINYLKMTPGEEKSLGTFIKSELKEKLALQYINLFLSIRRNNKLLLHNESVVSRGLWTYYMNQIYKSYRKLRQYKIQYDKMNFFLATEKNGTLKKNLEFKFSIFSSKLDLIRQNTLAINKDIFSKKPEDLSLSSRIQDLLRLDTN